LRTRRPRPRYRDGVPQLGVDNPLPHRPARVLVAGTSGAGKTTLAGRVAEVLTLPRVEIDALFHGRAWSTHPRTSERVAALRALRPELVVVRLPGRRAVDQWVDGPLARAAT
jgi:Mg-chelatase subunit ChlI